MTDSEYLVFRELPTPGKTKVISVDSKRSGGRLGTIKWYGAWRQYTFQPWAGTIWNTGCLQDVNAYIEELMVDRRRRG